MSRFRSPEFLLLVAVVAFLGTTAAWLTVDARVPDFDSGRHLHYSFVFHDALRDGRFLVPIEDFTNYPPFAHLIGAIGVLVAGVTVPSAVMTQNLIFVPLLALGCYGTGRVVYGRIAGALAAVFALGTPMIVSLFHLYTLDAPQTAMVAVAVWLTLASKRFAHLPLAVLAGACCGLALLVKPTSVFFVAGPVAVAVLRGGWRQPLGLALFAAAGAVVAGPWYVMHVDDLRGLTSGALAGGSGGGSPITPPRWGAQNFGWYFWNLFNLQLMVPLGGLFLGGTAAAVWRYLRERRPDDLTPELVVGGLVGFVGVTYLSLKDPRYSLPALVYMAVLGTGWTAWVRPRLREVATAGIALLAAANLALISTSSGERLRVSLPNAPDYQPYQRSFTVHEPEGYLAGAPREDGEVLEIMRAMHRDGVRVVEFDPGSNVINFNGEGLAALAQVAGLQRPSRYVPEALERDQAFMLRHLPEAGDPPPCATLEDGSTVYVVLGNPLRPFKEYRFYCPTRQPRFYERKKPAGS